MPPLNPLLYRSFQVALFLSAHCEAAPADITPAERAEHEKTVQVYTSNVLRSNPRDARAYQIRGYAYFSLGQNDLALADYSEAIRFAPGFSDNYRHRAAVYCALGRSDKALADLNQAIRLSPQLSETYLERASVYWTLRQFPQAGADFQRAVTLSPNNAAACNSLAWFLIYCPREELRDERKAVQFAQQACDLTGGKVPDYLETLRGAREKQAKRTANEFKSLEELLAKPPK